MGGAEGKKYFRSLAERYVPPMAKKWGKVGPRHPAWKKRIKLEIVTLSKYIKFLKSELPRPWFQLKPDPNPKYNYTLWRGFITIPKRPEIKFKMVILLSGEYPNVIPRCLIEDRITNYTGKMYLKNNWTDPEDNIKYTMICHDHMGQVEGIWEPNLGIAHFFIREVFIWWAAQMNLIIKVWDEKHGN